MERTSNVGADAQGRSAESNENPFAAAGAARGESRIPRVESAAKDVVLGFA
jgi:hypothetical protein